MTEHEVRKLLQRKTWRGIIVFRILYVALCAAATVIIVLFWLHFSISCAWGILAFVLGCTAYLGWQHVANRFVTAGIVSHDPAIVYWAHVDGDLDAAADNCTVLILHLRNGRRFSVELPNREMRDFVAWLRERNPHVRWGRFDPPPPRI